jgi:hypothetical protein
MKNRNAVNLKQSPAKVVQSAEGQDKAKKNDGKFIFGLTR